MKLSYRSAFALFTMFLLSVFMSYFQYYEESRSAQAPQPKQARNSQVAMGLDSMKTPTPQCDNIFENMTRGRWVKKVDLKQYADQIEAITQQEENQLEEMKTFWMERGVQSATYSQDSRCGYKQLVAFCFFFR